MLMLSLYSEQPLLCPERIAHGNIALGDDRVHGRPILTPLRAS